MDRISQASLDFEVRGRQSDVDLTDEFGRRTVICTGAVSLMDGGGRSTSVEAFAKPIQNKAVGVLFLPRNLHRGPLFECFKIFI